MRALEELFDVGADLATYVTTSVQLALAFPDAESARQMWASPEFQEAVAIRRATEAAPEGGSATLGPEDPADEGQGEGSDQQAPDPAEGEGSDQQAPDPAEGEETPTE